MKDIDYTLLEEQASWIGGLMDDERLEAIERTALRGVWNLLHASWTIGQSRSSTERRVRGLETFANRLMLGWFASEKTPSPHFSPLLLLRAIVPQPHSHLPPHYPDR